MDIAMLGTEQGGARRSDRRPADDSKMFGVQTEPATFASLTTKVLQQQQQLPLSAPTSPFLSPLTSPSNPLLSAHQRRPSTVPRHVGGNDPFDPALGQQYLDEDFRSTVHSVREAIARGIYPQRISQGSSGSYFCRNIEGDIVGVFKPKNEEPYGIILCSILPDGAALMMSHDE
jgi:hypothetical protein